jgi:hypothetical protein
MIVNEIDGTACIVRFGGGSRPSPVSGVQALRSAAAVSTAQGSGIV